jgi:peptidoglycan/LPS O-acetylase OafA/YrhL
VRWGSAAVFVMLFFVCAMTPWPWHGFRMDYALGLATTLFLWVVLSARARMDPENPVVRASRRLARSSYSVYLVHYPFLAFTSVLVGVQGRWGRCLVAGAVACAVALIYSFGVAACTEWHNETVRRWVEQKISARRKMSEPAPAGS